MKNLFLRFLLAFVMFAFLSPSTQASNLINFREAFSSSDWMTVAAAAKSMSPENISTLPYLFLLTGWLTIFHLRASKQAKLAVVKLKKSRRH